MLFIKRKTIITHSGSYHTDDIFAVATLSMFLDGKVRVVRSREAADFVKGDYVVDVGGEYDPARGRFDHHQKGGAGVRDNGIPYASFGLVWKEFGMELCGNNRMVWEAVDRRLVVPVDAVDNGVDLSEPKFAGIYPYRIQDVFGAFNPEEESPEAFDRVFATLVAIAEKILRSEIRGATAYAAVENIVAAAYEKSEDKRIVLITAEDMHREPAATIASRYPEPLYIVVPMTNGNWKVVCVHEPGSFIPRKAFPSAWAGLRDELLAKASGVPDAIFCHQKLLCIAASREGAVQMAKNAVES